MASTGEHNLSFHSGERQTASSYSEIRADHRFRYEWAARLIPEGGVGLDVFCGNGYGAWLLAQSRNVLAFDGSKEAIQFATDHYGGPRVRFSHAYWPFELPRETFNFIVSLESVEHVPDGDVFFSEMCSSLRPGGILIYSTPNEELLPLASTGNHFHYRHYTLAQAQDLAAANGLEVFAWAGQNTYQMTAGGQQGPLLDDQDMALRDGIAGQFCITACRKRRRRWYQR